MITSFNPEHIIRTVDKYEGRRGALISILEDIQADHNYLPSEALKIVSRKTGHSMVDIYGIATFYRSFSLEPRGRHLVSVCMGTACHVRGAPKILGKFEKQLGIKREQTTADREFSLTTVNCLGACALGPVAVIDGEYHRNVASHQVKGIVDHHCQKHAERRMTDDERIFRVNVSCPHCNRGLMTYDHMMDGHPMVHVTVAFDGKHGWLRMSSLYGDYRIESEHEIPDDTVIDCFCPKCHGHLRTTRVCPSCDAPMIPLFVRGGGIVRFCSRRGCKEHMLDLG